MHRNPNKVILLGMLSHVGHMVCVFNLFFIKVKKFHNRGISFFILLQPYNFFQHHLDSFTIKSITEYFICKQNVQNQKDNDKICREQTANFFIYLTLINTHS